MIGLSLVAIFTLFMISRKSITQNDGFFRLFPPHVLGKWKAFEVKSNMLMIGHSDKDIFLTQAGTPAKLFKYDVETNIIENLDLTLPERDSIAWGAIQFYTNSDGVYAFEGLTPTILFGDLADLTLKTTSRFQTKFTSCLPLSPTSYIFKSYYLKTQQNVLIKQSLSPTIDSTLSNVLKKQVDGVFCTEGDLLFDPTSNSIIYVYRYRNEYLIFDTNLKPLGSGHTIDPIDKAQISVATYNKGEELHYAFSSPPLVVNKKSRVYNQRLFVHSNIKAKNEVAETFNSKSVIDVYSIPERRYLYSFYIPAYKELTAKDFTIAGNSLIVLYDGFLLDFSLSLPDVTIAPELH